MMEKTEEQKIRTYLVHKFRLAWRFYSDKRRACLKIKKCSGCNKYGKLVADHKEPVVSPVDGWKGWDTYYDRMFKGELQPMCVSCHLKKTRQENKIRKENKTKKEGKPNV